MNGAPGKGAKDGAPGLFVVSEVGTHGFLLCGEICGPIVDSWVSKTFDGIRFMAYVADHDPPHVHGTIGGVIVVLALLEGGGVALADRKDAISPGNAPPNVVTRIQRVAAANVDELWSLWEKVHGIR